MKFKEFRTLRVTNLRDIITFLNQDLYSLMKGLFVGLTRLNFQDNFDSFEVTVNLDVGVEVNIQNKFGRSTPSKFILVRNTKNSVIIEGNTWSSESVSLINRGPIDTTATIVFMR